jgi:hypothetical protein
MDSNILNEFDTSGFYHPDGEYAPNAVYNTNYTLLKVEKDSYIYPIDGWSWYNDFENASVSESYSDEINQQLIEYWIPPTGSFTLNEEII